MRLLSMAAAQQGIARIPAGMSLWLSADKGVTYDGDNKVSQWNDQSGNDYHAVTHLMQPLYVSNGINELPTIDFTSGTLKLSDGLDMFRNKAAATVVVVKQLLELTSGVKASFRATTDQSGFARVNIEEGRTTDRYNVSGRRLDSDSFLVRNGTSSLTDSPIIHSGVFDWENASASLYLDGIFDDNTTDFHTEGNSDDTDSELIVIGSGSNLTSISQGFNGYISEILAYDRVLSASDFTLLHNYLLNKYGI